MAMVNDQLFTPLLTYLSILNTLRLVRAAERRRQLRARGARPASRTTATIAFDDLFTGDQPSAGAAAYVVAPINFLLRNAFEDVELEGLNLEIDASEQPRSATLERVWLDGTRAARRHARSTEGAAAHLSRRGDHAHGAGADSGQRERQRLDDGGRRRRASRSGKRASCRCSRCSRAACRR